LHPSKKGLDAFGLGAGDGKGECGQEGRLRGRGVASIIRKSAVQERERLESFDEGRGFGRGAFHDVIIIDQIEEMRAKKRGGEAAPLKMR
jgi:hypothetical protein